MHITVYTFESKDGSEFGTYQTQDLQEAMDYAQKYHLRVIANDYEWADSEEVIDYTTNEEDE